MSERLPASSPSSLRDSAPARPARENPFETETMAELCVRQGHRDEGLAIYRRLLGRAADASARARLGARVALLEANPALASAMTPPPVTPVRADPVTEREPSAPLLDPGLRAAIAGEELVIDWRLPPADPRPRELQLLLVIRTATGVVTETRSLRLDAEAGHLALHVHGLHSARAAAGYRREDRFVPLLRAP